MSDESNELGSLRAAAHPLRLRMLSLLTGTAMSAAEIARELDITHANASYHLRLLLAAGELVVEGEERIRGGVAKKYRHPWRDSRAYAGGSPEDRGFEIRALTSELLRRFGERRDGSPTLLTDAELWVDAEVWAEARQHLFDASALVHDAAQAPHAEGTVHVNLTVVGFEMNDGADDGDSAGEQA